jgi:Helix-loop-helix DNA-binding domain
MASNPNPNQPPAPFTDFEFSFDPSLNGLFPPPPPLPPSAGLFSDSETTDLLGFLDNFNWEFDASPLPQEHQQEQPLPFHYGTPSSTQLPTLHHSSQLQPQLSQSQQQQHLPRQPQSPSTSTPPTSRNKHLLSSPQKRLNHIMSEQKRRNAIREGYAQLTTLLAPKGAPPGTGMPTRGRPKGSGSRGKGRTKGKSGVLFRAVEYCHWLEEGIEELREEVRMAEAAAGIGPG